MEETKANILKYMEEQYTKTKFPYHKRSIITALFGPLTDQALTALQKEGFVFPRAGVAEPLVQYIIDEPTREKIKNHFLKTNK